MSDKNNSAKSAEIKVYKEEEFEAFIKALEEDAVYNWVQIAKALGVDRDTIASWKALPRAQQAIKTGIDNAMKGMLSAGKKDWRMWESKLKMLGVSPVEKSETDLTTNGKDVVFPIYGGKSKV